MLVYSTRFLLGWVATVAIIVATHDRWKRITDGLASGDLLPGLAEHHSLFFCRRQVRQIDFRGLHRRVSKVLAQDINAW
jgi:hypothetical protein